MKKPPLTFKLVSVMLICIICFVSSSTTLLLGMPSIMAIMQMAGTKDGTYWPWLLYAGLFALPLYCSHTFARILVRRSILSARLFLAVVLFMNAFAALVAWDELRTEPLWLLAWTTLWILPMLWLFLALVPRNASASRET